MTSQADAFSLDSDFAAMGGWPDTLSELMKGFELEPARARSAMSEILAGSATSAQVAAFIVGLRMKGETSAEMGAMLDAMLDASARVELEDLSKVIDIVGTGGDRSNSINVSTISAIVAAGAGAQVCKHGNRAASSKCGSADLLEALGVKIDLDAEGVKRCVETVGIGFCLATVFHASMRHAGPTRRELGVPTVFNVLGPLANPARVQRYLVGVGDESLALRMAEVLRDHGTTSALIVHGGDGLDELTVTTTSNVIRLADGKIDRDRVVPSDFGFETASLDDIRGGDPATNAKFATEILNGRPGPMRDIITLNAGAALAVAGQADGIKAGVEVARESIDSGAAMEVLTAWIAESNR